MVLCSQGIPSAIRSLMEATCHISARVYRKMFERPVCVDFVYRKACAVMGCASHRYEAVEVDDVEAENTEPVFLFEN